MPVTEIYNISIKLSYFPEDSKVAKLKSLYRKDYKTDPKKLRPIPLLPTVRKIIEKLIQHESMNYLTEYNILFRYQSKFSKNHPTDTSLSYLTNKILTGFSSALLTGIIFVNQQKALDTINHDILLKKMSPLRFSDHSITWSNSINWFKSYLSHRSFWANINPFKTEAVII